MDREGPQPPKLTPCLLLFHSWAFGSNSLPIAGSVGMGVARRTQRQFPMPPRALPPGRMGLLSPSGIGGISPRHALTSPSLGGQGRQVSQWEAEGLALLGLGWSCLSCACPCVCTWAWLKWERLLCQLHRAWAWASSHSTHHFLFSSALCRTCGLPTLEAATACPARAAALCSAPTPFRSIHRPRPFSCSLQVSCLHHWGSASTTPLGGPSLIPIPTILPAPPSTSHHSVPIFPHHEFSYTLPSPPLQFSFSDPACFLCLLSPLLPTPHFHTFPSCVTVLVSLLVSVTISLEDSSLKYSVWKGWRG